jgi:hypothetical protein
MCENWSLKLRRELRVFENVLLRSIFGAKKNKKWEVKKNCITKNFIIFTARKILLDFKIKENKMSRTCSKYGKEEKCIASFGGNTRNK